LRSVSPGRDRRLRGAASSRSGTRTAFIASRANTLALSQSSQQITNPRRIGFLVYPGWLGIGQEIDALKASGLL
jgi:hypothetical protein